MNSLVRAATGYFLGRIGTAVLVVAFLVLLPFAVLPPIVRRVTWRVRNRLFLTYFLVGVLPIILIFLFVQLALNLVLSQTVNFLLHGIGNRAAGASPSKGSSRLKSLELAGVCNPARVVSGDYYDFIPLKAHFPVWRQ